MFSITLRCFIDNIYNLQNATIFQTKINIMIIIIKIVSMVLYFVCIKQESVTGSLSRYQNFEKREMFQ